MNALRRTLNRLAGECGSATYIAVCVMFTVTLFASGAMRASIGAQQGGNRDRNVKQELAALDAGVEIATYRLNKVDTTATDPCVYEVAGALVPGAPASDGWCTAVTGTLSNGTPFSYRIKLVSVPDPVNGVDLIQKRILVTSTYQNVTRRAYADVAAKTGEALFGPMAIQSTGDVTIDRSARVTGDIAGNGTVSLKDSSVTTGEVRYGFKIDPDPPGPPRLVGTSTQIPTPSKPKVNLSPHKAAGVHDPQNNDNGRLDDTNGVLPGGRVDPFIPTAGPSWNSSTKILQIPAGTTVTLTGETYSFCRLEISGGTLIVANAAKPNIYFDKPYKGYQEANGSRKCDDQTEPLSVTNGGRILTTSGLAGDMHLEIEGSKEPGHATTANIASTGTTPQYFTVYAPNTDINITNSANVNGAVSGKSVHVGSTSNSNAKLTYVSSVSSVAEDLIPVYRRTTFVECKPVAPNSAPDSGC